MLGRLGPFGDVSALSHDKIGVKLVKRSLFSSASPPNMTPINFNREKDILPSFEYLSRRTNSPPTIRTYQPLIRPEQTSFPHFSYSPYSPEDASGLSSPDTLYRARQHSNGRYHPNNRPDSRISSSAISPREQYQPLPPGPQAPQTQLNSSDHMQHKVFPIDAHSKNPPQDNEDANRILRRRRNTECAQRYF